LSISSDNGTSFSVPKSISSFSGDHSSPQITSSGNNVYVAYSNDGKILFLSSANNGDDFNSSSIADVLNVFSSPQLSAIDLNVYVSWATDNQILLLKSEDNGSSFGAEKPLGSIESVQSTPTIASFGNDVYVVWSTKSHIKLASSLDAGNTFASEKNIAEPNLISSSPNIAASGDLLYVAWQTAISDGDIKLLVSGDKGGSFGAEKNLSNSPTTSSLNPHVTAEGGNVFVVWVGDNNPIANVLLAASDDQGSTFDNTQVNEVEKPSINPQVASSGTNIFLTWQDFTGSVLDILFSIATTNCPCISFDESIYRDSEEATITIIEDTPSGAPSIQADVISSEDPSGIDLTLTPTGVAGTYEGTVTFTTASSSGSLLQVKAGDAITASFGGNNGIALIFPKTVEYDKGGSPVTSPFDVQGIAHPQVIDQNSNLDPNVVDTVPVKITSLNDTTGFTMILPETGPDTGIFGGESLSNLIFLDGNDLLTSSSIVTITQEIDKTILDPKVIDTTTVSVSSTSDPVGLTLTLQETDVDSGIFSGPLELNPFITAAPPLIPTPSLLAQGGDFVTIKHGLLKYNTMVTPNPNPANGAIKVSITPTDADEVTVTLNPSITIPVFDGFAPGGGGGGLVRPGLVVNVLAGASSIAGIFGGGGGGTAVPLITGSTLFLEPKAGITQLGEGLSSGGESLLVNLDDSSGPTTIQTGEDTTFTFDVYENQGISNLEHVTMYFFIGEDADLSANHNDVSKSDTYILFDTGQSVHVTDPHGYFENTSFDVSEITPWKLKIIYDITFAKPMETTSLLIRTWDLDKNTADKVIINAIEVVEPSFFNVPLELVSQDSTQTELEDIPIWVKNNALWWQEKQIDDSDFVAGIEYLINENIITISETQSITAATTDEIPDWISEVAGFWAHDSISDAEFVQSIQWLISNGVMVVA